MYKSAHSSVVKTGLNKRSWQKRRQLADEQKAFRGQLREMREAENKIVKLNIPNKFINVFTERTKEISLQSQAKEKGRKHVEGLFIPTCNSFSTTITYLLD